jgi:hypothetical protein
MTDKELIKNFCSTKKTEYLKKISENAKKILIEYSYNVLFQKHGNMEIAKLALKHFGEIDIIKYKEGLNETRESRKINKEDWKKLNKSQIEEMRREKSAIVYTGKQDIEGYESLKKRGFVTIEIFNKKELEKIEKLYPKIMRGFPEYARSSENPDLDSVGNPLLYVLGGFAAFANPASFHNPMVRNIRKRLRKKVLPIFREMIGDIMDKKRKNNTKLEMLIDRMVFRHKSQAPSAESWHRDVTPKKYLLKGDEIFGGWVNLDIDKTQKFSCIFGSHLGVNLRSLKEGFAALPKDQMKKLNKVKSVATIPPGHVIIFPQYIFHEVVSKKASYDMRRLFSGWRTTIDTGPLFQDIEQMLRDQAVIPLPSGQLPPLYSANHRSCFLRKAFNPIRDDKKFKVSTMQWSDETFKKTGPSGVSLFRYFPPRNGKEGYKLVSRHMQSLKKYGFPMYKEYSKEEIELYKPNKI